MTVQERAGALGVIPIECVGMDENGCGFCKRATVFLEVVEGLAGVPREHICVYTLISGDWKEPRRSRDNTRGSRIEVRPLHGEDAAAMGRDTNI